jgi:predicted lipoprotein with Yx(FWY)xxD motif
MNRSHTRVIFGCIAAVALGLWILPNSQGSRADPVVVSAAIPAAPSQVTPDYVDPESAEKPPPAVVAVATAPFGPKMVDGSGRTLYVFSLDAPGTSRCVGACARTWPPARSLGGKPQPGPGVASPAVGNIQRPDASEQMTFNGRPLYYYSGDTSPGQSNGHGRSEFGGAWSAQPPARPAGSR